MELNRVFAFTILHNYFTILHMDMPVKRASLSDQDAIRLIRKIARVQEANEVLQLELSAMDRAIAQLLQKGVSVRQLSRRTGIPRGHADSINRRKRN